MAASAGAEASGGTASSAGLAAPSGTLDCASQAGVDAYAAGLKKASQSGAFQFELVSSTPAPPAQGDNTFLVRVTAADGTPLTGQLNATLDMPEHGHTSPKTPVITFDAASGTFSLDPMYLFMVGLWRIAFTFEPDAASGAAGASDAASAADFAVFQFCVD